jgi:hypothetical protein
MLLGTCKALNDIRACHCKEHCVFEYYRIDFVLHSVVDLAYKATTKERKCWADEYELNLKHVIRFFSI